MTVRNTVTSATTGNVYHLFQLQEPSFWEPEESISVAELENDLGDGYYAQTLIGANTGLRRWKLKLGTLASNQVPSITSGVTGTTLTREQYLWELFMYTKVSGQPFVFKSPRNGQYYFARFADKELSYQKMKVKIYSTGVELKQVRLPGEAVFTLYRSGADLYSPLDIHGGSGTTNANVDFWLKGTDTDESGNGAGFTNHDAVTETTVNSIPVSRFHATGTSAYMLQDDANGDDYYDIFLLMKVRTGTFDAFNSAVLSGFIPGDVLVGSASATTFSSLSGVGTGNVEYRLNGVLYTNADLEAPMNTFGIVHLRFPTGLDMGVITIGSTTDDAAKMDIAEVIAFDGQPITDSTLNETMEYLTARRDILNQ
jgi:hypothetical protein